MKVAIIYNKDLTGVINTFGMQNKEFYSEKAVRRVAYSLENAGHNVSVLDGNMYIIERLQNFMPRVIEGEQMGMVFNMAYGIQGESRYTHIPSMLEMLGIPYVGSNPSGHALALDKVMTKIIWQKNELPTPNFWVFNSAQDDFSKVDFPVIVKPKMESVSFGLKVVYNVDDLREAVNFIVTEFEQQALVEQFIPGREFCVGLLGNAPIESFPVLEIDLEGDPDAIQTVDDKQQKPRQKVCPANISDELAEKMVKFSVEAFKALNLRDFARVDIRLDQDENIHLLEINSMASLGETGSYVTAAKVAGYDFPKLVNKMLDVASIRYFSNNLMEKLPQETKRKLPLHSRLRTFLRGRQQNQEKLLKKLVNTNTHVRNVEGINQCSHIIKSELSALGFTNEVYPQLEVGNMFYLTNSFDEEIDFLLLLSLDNRVPMAEHEYYKEGEQRIHGTGVWENKGGIVTCISALQALRFAKLLRKVKIGIFLITDSTISGKFSRKLIAAKAIHAKNILGFHGSDHTGSLVTSRSGSASYKFSLKLVDSSDASNVALAAQVFNKTLATISSTFCDDPEDVVAPYDISFQSNIFKVYAFGSAKISARFNSLEKFEQIDQKIRKIVALSKNHKKLLQMHFEGGMKRPSMQESTASIELYDKIKTIAKNVDVRIAKEHRWSSADICNIQPDVAKIDGMGPIGGYDNFISEHLLRHSIIDRGLLLSLLLKGK